MRTKTLLLTAALTVASLATSMADVFSVNVVGYANVVCPPGFSIIANPLDATNNTIASLIPAPPTNTTVYTFNGSTFDISKFGYFDDNDNFVNAWSLPNLSLAPGIGAFINNPRTTNLTFTFVGEVLQGTRTNALTAGFNLKGSIVPQSGALDAVLGYPKTTNDTVYLLRSGAYQISKYGYFDDNDNFVVDWTSIPSPNVGEGFWIRTGAAKNWIRTFTVN